MCFNREKTKVLVQIGKEKVKLLFHKINPENWECMEHFANGGDILLGANLHYEYRWEEPSDYYSIKKETCQYFDGGIKFPKPLTNWVGFDNGDVYYAVEPIEWLAYNSYFNADAVDNERLKANLVHRTEEDAKLHLKAYIENQERIFGGN